MFMATLSSGVRRVNGKLAPRGSVDVTGQCSIQTPLKSPKQISRWMTLTRIT